MDEYARDVFAEAVTQQAIDDDAKRNVVELAAFARAFAEMRSQAEIEDSFPDLINPDIDAQEAARMYHRAGKETLQVLAKYPGMAPLLS